MKVLAFAASNSAHSINKKLVSYAVTLIDNVHADIIDLNDYMLPIYSPEQEAILGQPEQALGLLEKIDAAEAILISFAEHNSNYTAAYKNIFDWMTRIRGKVYANKPVIVMGTSPGGRGAQTVIELATASLPRFGADVRAHFSLPSFNDNFDQENNCIRSASLDAALRQALAQLT